MFNSYVRNDHFGGTFCGFWTPVNARALSCLAESFFEIPVFLVKSDISPVNSWWIPGEVWKFAGEIEIKWFILSWNGLNPNWFVVILPCLRWRPTGSRSEQRDQVDLWRRAGHRFIFELKAFISINPFEIGIGVSWLMNPICEPWHWNILLNHINPTFALAQNHPVFWR